MPKAASLPSLPAAVSGCLRSSGRGGHTGWNGKATQNETWSHKLSWCLKKCRQNGSLPLRQTRQLGLCSGNKSGPQLNDKSRFLRLTVTRLVDGARPREVLYRGVSSITATLHTSKRRHREAVFLPLVSPPSRHGDPSGTAQPHNRALTRAEARRQCLSCLIPSSAPKRARDPHPFPFPSVHQPHLTDARSSARDPQVNSPPHHKAVKPFLPDTGFGCGSPQEAASTPAPPGASGSHSGSRRPFPARFLTTRRCHKHLGYSFSP